MQSSTLIRRGLLAGVLSLALALWCPHLRAQETMELSFEYTNPEVLWDFVCEQNQDCGDLPPPVIRLDALYAEIGALGAFYWQRPDSISIDLPMTWAFKGSRVAVDAVIVHEMQHYHDYSLGLIPGIPSDRAVSCRAEGRGFAMQAQYLLLNFAEQHIETDWRLRYGC